MAKANKGRGKKKQPFLRITQWSKWKFDIQTGYESRHRIILLEMPGESSYLNACVGWQVMRIEESEGGCLTARLRCAKGDVNVFADLELFDSRGQLSMLSFDENLRQCLNEVKCKRATPRIRAVDITTRETEIRQELSPNVLEAFKPILARYHCDKGKETEQHNKGELPCGKIKGTTVHAKQTYAVVGLRLDGMKKIGYAFCRPQVFIQEGALAPFRDLWFTLSSGEDDVSDDDDKEIWIELAEGSEEGQQSSSASPMSMVEIALEEYTNGKCINKAADPQQGDRKERGVSPIVTFAVFS